jgi:hypothetical protein
MLKTWTYYMNENGDLVIRDYANQQVIMLSPEMIKELMKFIGQELVVGEE